MRGALLLVLGLVALALVVGTLPFVLQPGTQLETEVLQAGLEVPWDLDFTADGRLIVSERPGRLRVYASAAPGAALLQVLEVANVRAEGESGAMGLAVDADFPREPFLYLCASVDADGAAGDGAWHNVILRFRFGGAGEGQLQEDGVVFGEPMVAAVHHNGCALEMDAQRHLWFTMGDGNIPAATVNPAQDPGRLNGKVLRINADGSIPDDNPILPGTGAPTAVWSMGHRNPQALAFAADGSLFETEHGTDTDDEINRIVPGGNYGYACWSDTANTGPAQDGPARAGCGSASDYLPAAWSSASPTIAPSGARFVQGPAWGALDGSLFVATLKEQDLRRFIVDATDGSVRQVEILLDGRFGRLRAVVRGPDSALYLTTSNGSNDAVIRVAPPA